VILLSATPYRLYTTHGAAGTESHHEDLLRTVEFLLGCKSERETFEGELRAYGEDLVSAAATGRSVKSEVVGALEKRLRRVMVRTERLSVSGDRCGMLSPGLGATSPLAPEDLSQFVLVDGTATALGCGDTIDYWKSAPYLLNLMDHGGYRLKERFLQEIRDGGAGSPLAQAVCDGADALLHWPDMESYACVAPANARMRALGGLAQPDGVSSLLWVPPVLPYYHASSGPYANPGLRDHSKTLVFSSWQIVPKTVSVLLSYEAERKMMEGDLSAGRSYRYSDYSERPRLLEFRLSDGRREQMTHMLLLYPSVTLATLFDPAAISSTLDGAELPAEADVLAVAKARAQDLITAAIPGGLSADGPEDMRWYWMLPVMLDRQDRAVRDWLTTQDEKLAWDSMVPTRQDQGNFAAYVGNLRVAMEEELDGEELGRPPSDLAEVIARMALGSPAVVALRALLRATGNPREPADRIRFLAEAARIALGFRSLFNMPMVSAMVRREHPIDERGYWRSVLAYCGGGNLQAVLDEYCHVLHESLGLLDREPSIKAAELATEVAAAVSLRTTNLELDEITVDAVSGAVRVADRRRSVRCRFAMRFGDGRSDREGGGLEPDETRKEQVRQAFNSPFWPFVLATTSVGQEGLDFHPYCRHIMHWNLPSNPVDLEQREGRVHRYKGHAVRWNVATHVAAHRLPKGLAALDDVWSALFDAAKAAIGDPEGLVPYWLVPEGHYQIQRHVPLYPLSREHARFDDLKQKLALYRLAFGQPRQEDLLAYLQSRSVAGPDTQFKPVYVDLSPKLDGGV
ncbi:MAG: helicase-related protein, partial [Kiritimatiellae bacterium]|nr:helicase-related protein [Kiritimatiellia bacterium]